MTIQDKEFEKRLLATFLTEADEHIRAVSLGLIELEKGSAGEELNEKIEKMFRAIHSLKGAARSVGQKEVENVCHPLESVFSALKRHEIVLTPETFDLVHDSINTLNQILSYSHSSPSIADRGNIRLLIRKLGEVAQGRNEEARVPAEMVAPVDTIRTPEAVKLAEGSVRIQSKRLDPLLLQAEELILTKIAYGQRIADFDEIESVLLDCHAEFPKWKSRQMTNNQLQYGELIYWIEERMSKLERMMDVLKQNIKHDHHELTRIVDDHLDGMKHLLLLPFSSMAEGFPIFIRELARDQQKEVRLIMQGEGLEIDRRILDELKDPLIHLLRNSVDHAIESPQQRVTANKPSQGTIRLSFSLLENHQVEIMISDDGRGIDLEKVLATAIRNGLVQKEDAASLSTDAITSFIFRSGISTKDVITDLSGRGIGLAIVREKVERSGGSISVRTRQGEGTTIAIRMPVTFTTFRGILVSAAGQSFMIPTTNVERVTRVSSENKVTVENRDAVIFGGQHLAAVSLAEILELPIPVKNNRTDEGPWMDHREAPYAIIQYNGQRIAFQIDEVLSEHQFLLKSLGKQLHKVKGISGATVLGTGQVVPVLNIADLVKMAMKPGFSKSSPLSASPVEKKEKHILIAEDSITSRMLLKNILEGSGYLVNTAVDGMDAYTQAREGKFDMLISDVDMPRMNGFELCRKVRSHHTLAELPIILITSLSKREDREQGIDAGANAYIVKSNFEQGNLLEVIRKFI